jgi:hypothetical protein
MARDFEHPLPTSFLLQCKPGARALLHLEYPKFSWPLIITGYGIEARRQPKYSMIGI